MWKCWALHPAYRRISNDYFFKLFFDLFVTESGIAFVTQSGFSVILEGENKASAIGKHLNPTLGSDLHLVKQWEAEDSWERSWRGSIWQYFAFWLFSHCWGLPGKKIETAWVSTHINFFVKSSLFFWLLGNRRGSPWAHFLFCCWWCCCCLIFQG